MNAKIKLIFLSMILLLINVNVAALKVYYSCPTDNNYITEDTLFDLPAGTICNVNDNGSGVIIFNANNITLDLNYIILNGNGTTNSKGINTNSKTNLTIKNFDLNNYYNGIYLNYSHNTKIFNGRINWYQLGGINDYNSLNLEVYNLNFYSGDKVIGGGGATFYLSNTYNARIHDINGYYFKEKVLTSTTANNLSFYKNKIQANSGSNGLIQLTTSQNNQFYDNNFFGVSSGYPLYISSNSTDTNFYNNYLELSSISAFVLPYSNKLNFEKNYLKGATIGFYFGNNVSSISIKNNNFIGLTIPNYFLTQATITDVNIIKNQFINSTLYNAYFDNSLASNILFQDNNFYGGNHIGIQLVKNVSELIIKNNYFSGLDKAIYLHPSSNQFISNVSIQGNIIYNNAYGSYIDGNVFNVTFNDNNFYFNSTKNIQFALNNSVYPANNLIYNNAFYGTTSVSDTNNQRLNTYNIIKTNGINILGGSKLGGNYWSELNTSNAYDEDFDRIADNLIYTSGTITDNLPLIYFGKYNLDANIIKIDGYPINALKTFNYYIDGNLTIDVNVFNLSNSYSFLDVNYSLTQTQGTGTKIIDDLNLAKICGTQFNVIKTCSFDWNIFNVSDANYYLNLYFYDANLNKFKTTTYSVHIKNVVPYLKIMFFDEETFQVIKPIVYANETLITPNDDNKYYINVFNQTTLLVRAYDENYPQRKFYFFNASGLNPTDVNAVLLKKSSGTSIDFQWYNNSGNLQANKIISVYSPNIDVGPKDENLIDDFEDGDYTNNPTWTLITDCGATPAVTTTDKYNGNYSLKIQAGNCNETLLYTRNAQKGLSAYIKVIGQRASIIKDVVYPYTNNAILIVLEPGNTFKIAVYPSNNYYGSYTIQSNTWYKIELIDTNTTTLKARLYNTSNILLDEISFPKPLNYANYNTIMLDLANITSTTTAYFDYIKGFNTYNFTQVPQLLVTQELLNSTAEQTMFLKRNPAYTITIEDTNYNYTKLTIKKPKNEITEEDINSLYNAIITGINGYYMKDVNGEIQLNVYNNTKNYYYLNLEINSNEYLSRKTLFKIQGPITDYNIQTYHPPSTTGAYILLSAKNNLTLMPIENVLIEIYKNLAQNGLTLISKEKTDAKGDILIALNSGDTYTFKVYYNNNLLDTKEVKITATTLYITFGMLTLSSQEIISANNVVVSFLPKSSISWYTKTIQIKIKSQVQEISQIIINYKQNNTTFYQNVFTNVGKEFTHSINLEESPFTDINRQQDLIIQVIVFSGDYNITFEHIYKFYLQANISGRIYEELTTGLRNELNCSIERNSFGFFTQPCSPLIIFSLIITIIICGAIILLTPFRDPKAISFIATALIGLFAYLGFIPAFGFALMILLAIATAIWDLGGRF